MKLSHVLAFLGGAAVGAAIGLLLAPDSGKNTREKIANALKEKGIVLDKEALSDFIDKVVDKLHGDYSDEDLHDAVDEVANEK